MPSAEIVLLTGGILLALALFTLMSLQTYSEHLEAKSYKDRFKNIWAQVADEEKEAILKSSEENPNPSEWQDFLDSVRDDFDCNRLGVELGGLTRARAIEKGIKVHPEETDESIEEKIALLKELNKEKAAQEALTEENLLVESIESKIKLLEKLNRKKAALAREKLLMVDLPLPSETMKRN